jgi:signal transduction histidine kinase
MDQEVSKIREAAIAHDDTAIRQLLMDLRRHSEVREAEFQPVSGLKEGDCDALTHIDDDISVCRTKEGGLNVYSRLNFANRSYGTVRVALNPPESTSKLWFQALLALSLGFIGTMIVAYSVGLAIFRRNITGPIKGILLRMRKGESSISEKHGPELQKLSVAIEDLVNERSRNASLVACGEMAAEVAHDLRQPLAIVHTFVERACTYISDPQFRDLFSKYGQDNVRRLRRLADDLTNLSHNESRRELCNLKTLLQEVAQEYQEAHHTGAPPIRLEIDTDEASCSVDPSALKRVVLNLVENAEAAAKGRGVIRLRLKPRPAPQSGFEIQVKDDGAGMEDSQMPLIFDSFYTTKRNGTGLGLSISRKIVSQHGGEMFARSKKGKGSTFGICLPLPERIDP